MITHDSPLGRALLAESVEKMLREELRMHKERIRRLRDALESVQYDLPPDLVAFVTRRLADDSAAEAD